MRRVKAMEAAWASRSVGGQRGQLRGIRPSPAVAGVSGVLLSSACNDCNQLITTRAAGDSDPSCEGSCLSPILPSPPHLCNSWAPGQPVPGRPGTICFSWGVGLPRGCTHGGWAPWKGGVAQAWVRVL